MKGNRNAIAETIENNVRRTILTRHLNDPAYYERMSALLQEIITARKARAIEYEEYLTRIAQLARQVEAAVADDTPEPLKHSPALRALYNNLKQSGATPSPANVIAEGRGDGAGSGDPALDMAVEIDGAVKRVRPDDWRGVQARENTIKEALFRVLKNQGEVERIFLIVKAQSEY